MPHIPQLLVPASDPPSPAIQIASLSHSFATLAGIRRALADVTFTVGPGATVALIGENGSGKSTLLRAAVGALSPDAGTVLRPQVGYLPQEVDELAWDTFGDALDAALAPAREAVREVERASSMIATRPGDAIAERRLATAIDRADALRAWTSDADLGAMLAGLGLAEIAPARTLRSLSGGQRRRLALVLTLAWRPCGLIMDEPTNHLDQPACEYLASVISDWPGPVLFASHDRAFIGQAATAIVDLDQVAVGRGAHRLPDELRPGRPAGDGGIWYGGTIEQYLQDKRAKRAAWQVRYEEEQAELGRLRRASGTAARRVSHRRAATDNDKFVTKYRAARTEAEVSKRVRSVESKLVALEAAQVPRPPSQLRLQLEPAGDGFGGDRVRRGRVSESGAGGGGLDASAARAARPAEARAARQPAGAQSRTLLWADDLLIPGIAAPRLDLRASTGDRVAVMAGTRLLITGANGTGKSTLLHALAGDELPPGSTGVVGRAERVRVGLLEQETPLGAESRSARVLVELAAGEGASSAQNLGALIAPRDADRPVRELSIGQQRRVLLAMVISQNPDVLLLDEPTNHLSIPLIDDLVIAFQDWPGALVVASHDPWLQSAWTGQRINLDWPPQNG